MNNDAISSSEVQKAVEATNSSAVENASSAIKQAASSADLDHEYENADITEAGLTDFVGAVKDAVDNGQDSVTLSSTTIEALKSAGIDVSGNTISLSDAENALTQLGSTDSDDSSTPATTQLYMSEDGTYSSIVPSSTNTQSPEVLMLEAELQQQQSEGSSGSTSGSDSTIASFQQTMDTAKENIK